ncbi:MAG: hypothetical protein IKV85_06350 [Ruminococcus sp.]|nr:hypothetical protein [Ruminococcus sp.]
MKELLLKSVFFIMVNLIIFLPMYFFMIYSEEKSNLSNNENIYGNWKGFQYYCGNERFPCDDENYMEIKFSKENIIVSENIIADINGEYIWENGRTLNLKSDNTDIKIMLSLTGENLKITSEDGKYIVLLNKTEG